MNRACPTAAKRRYATRGAAERAALELTLVADGILMRAYRCPCSWWHLTRRHSHHLPCANTARRTA